MRDADEFGAFYTSTVRRVAGHLYAMTGSQYLLHWDSSRWPLRH
jgi:hypothetical protein